MSRTPGRTAQGPGAHPGATGRCAGRLPAARRRIRKRQRRVPISSLPLLASTPSVRVEALIGAPGEARRRQARSRAQAAAAARAGARAAKSAAEVRDANARHGAAAARGLSMSRAMDPDYVPAGDGLD